MALEERLHFFRLMISAQTVFPATWGKSTEADLLGHTREKSRFAFH